jgi:FtsH-binding integral membrane protein
MEKTQIFDQDRRVTSKFLAVVFGYMFLGLLLTAVTGFLFALFMARAFYDAGTNYLTDQGVVVLVATLIGAAIGSWIDTIVMAIVSAKTGKAPWVGYIIYALLFGVIIGSFLLIPGMDFATMGEAFGITALAFFAMFLVGYFSKVNLNPLAFVGISLLIGVILASLFFGIWYLIVPSDGAMILFDFVVSIIVVVATMLITAWDANNMAKIVEKGAANQNIALYCAFSLYTDFITILIRIIYILLIAKNRN